MASPNNDNNNNNLQFSENNKSKIWVNIGWYGVMNKIKHCIIDKTIRISYFKLIYTPSPN